MMLESKRRSFINEGRERRTENERRKFTRRENGRETGKAIGREIGRDTGKVPGLNLPVLAPLLGKDRRRAEILEV